MVGDLRIYIIDEHMPEAVKELWNEAVSCTMNMPENDDQEKKYMKHVLGGSLLRPIQRYAGFKSTQSTSYWM
jgi:hypothetical protein